jgi:DNA ligase D-like protein (predicted ligase)
MAVRTSHAALPAFIAPMLAKPAAAFDADDYLFEFKWDGIRTLAFRDRDGYRLLNRRRIEMTARYPEFAFLAELPPGTVLDGEMVVLKDGKPDFALLMSREQSRTPRKIASLALSMPATCLVFDLLYESFVSLIAEPLRARRERLERLIRKVHSPRIALSEGVVGHGKVVFEEACRLNLEGVVAKRLSSPYLPGKRSDAWLKIKRGGTALCAIVGFGPSGPRDFRSLILAIHDDGELRYAGKVGSGISDKLHAHLNALLWKRLQKKPLVPCKIRGKWVAPGLYCKISYMERTPSGEFRAPVFEELCEE